MADETPNLALPYIISSQAQKHVTHNEALRVLDALTRLVVKSTRTTPPPSPADGDCYLVDDGANDDWAGKDGHLANWIDGAWSYHASKSGWLAWFEEDGQIRLYDGNTWVNPFSNGFLAGLGINTSADSTNRLALSSAASLFNHEGNGHQLKINKATTTDTVSLLFQTGWSGRAEMGLAGEDEFSIKVSPDGSNWRTALKIDGGGRMTNPERPAAKAILNAGTITPADGSETGFATLIEGQGGFTLGAATSSGMGYKLEVPADGLYAIAVNARIQQSGAFSLGLTANGTVELARIEGYGTATAFQSFHAAGLATLAAGDVLSFTHTGSASIATGTGETEVMLHMI